MMKNKLLLILFCLSLHVHAKTVAVVTRESTSIREAPSFLATAKNSIKYGDQVILIQRKGSWFKVKTPDGGMEGWLNRSELSSSSSVLREIGQGTSKSESKYRDEAVAAGKGFSPEYEQALKAQNKNLAFDKVDELERRAFTYSLEKFAIEGGLVLWK